MTAKRSAVVALVAALISACVAPDQKVAPRPFVCRPTVAHMTPPKEPLEFMIGGSSSPEAARRITPTLNWYGNDAMWVVLPPNGEIVGRLDEKIPPYRMKPGYVIWSARQLDRDTTVRPEQMILGYGDEGFQAGGPSFPHTGCWEVTYSLGGRDELRFELRVR